MKKLCFLFLLTVSVFSRAAQLPPGFVEILIAQNLDPTDMVLAPDGRIFITIKDGKIVVVQDGTLLPEPLLNIENQVDNFNERGLGHMVLDPHFEHNRFYYIYYTVKGENHNRVSRFTATGNFTVPGSELILLELDIVPGTVHNAGAMVFSEEKLLISVGDGADGNSAQAKNKLLGKILRINPDGSIPTDNPFFADATVTGKYKSIWALGFRNPFTMSLDSITGKIYANDVGQGSFEEVNEVVAGKNYGWPMIEGVRTTQDMPANYQDPVYAYPHGDGIGAGCSIIGSAFYSFGTYPAVGFPVEYRGLYFFADYCNGYIRMIDPVTGLLKLETFATNIDRPLAIRMASDGSMYYLARSGMGGGSTDDNTSTTNGRLWKVTYTGSGAPIVSVQPQGITVPIGENAVFSVGASGLAPFTYRWQENEIDITGATESTFTISNVQLSDNGKSFQCVISNSVGSVISNPAALSVTTNTRPTPDFSISLPNNATLYQAGQTINLTGTATDLEDGMLSGTSLSWKIDFHHDEHSHPGLSWTTGVGLLEYTIPIVGEMAEDVWLRIYLQAIDSEGLSKTIFKDVFPQKTNVTILTDPEGLSIKLDGTLIQTPYTFTGVTGLTRTLEAPLSQNKNGDMYAYQSWSETGAESLFSFQTPIAAKTFTASYLAVPLGEGKGLQGNYYTNQNKTFNGEPTLVRTDALIDFDWEGGSPAPSISNDLFTVRWSGDVLPPFSDTYTFYLVADDGIRLRVNDQLIINKWIDQEPTEWIGTVNLIADQKYPIEIEYYEKGGGATIKLYWSSSQLAKQIIPTSQLFIPFIPTVTGIENSIRELYELFPTATNNTITIQQKTIPSKSWDIVDSMGQSVLKGKTSTGSFEINVQSFSPGLYLFKVDTKIIRFVKL